MKNIRNKIILHDKYLDSFLKVVTKEGYAVPELVGIDKEYEFELANFVDFYNVRVNKNEILQTLLIFDEISFLNPLTQYDFSRLKNTGLINVVDDDRSIGYLGTEKIDMELLLQLKPVIIERLKKVFVELYKHMDLKRIKISYNKFLSVLYDFHIVHSNEIPNPTLEQTIVIDKYISYLDKQVLERKDVKLFRERDESEDLIKRMVAVTYMGYIQAELGTLLSLLDLSSSRNQVLMQKEFNFDKLITADKLPEFSQGSMILEGYSILRLSYQKLIDKLPNLESVDDVIKIKTSKAKEIKQLQEQLQEIEIDLREGRTVALKNVDKKVKAAVKDLNRNLKIQKVNKWLTYISLPISIVETALQLPPVLGFSAGIGSVGTTIKSKQIENKNGWLQVIR